MLARIGDVLAVLGIVALSVDYVPDAQLLDARKSQTRADLSRLAAALVELRRAHPSECPSLDDPRLPPGMRTRDAWDHDFVVACDARGVTVSSAGADGRRGTGDDLHRAMRSPSATR